MFYIFLLMSISTILSYLIFKFIYRIIFKSQKKISKFLVFLGSIILIIFYYTPYSFYLEPSFWQFRRICKLNELPNDEEKYNKILGYFDVSLDTLDWEKLNRNRLKLSKNNGDYIKNILEYRVKIAIKENRRYDMPVDLYANKKGFSRDNITYIELYGIWHTRRYILYGNEGSGWEWQEATLGCDDITSLKHKDYIERIQ